MKLSMSILARYLRNYHPDCAIVNDERVIRGLRFLPEGEQKLAPEYVYFGYAGQFLSDPRYTDACIVVNRKSQMLFWNCDYEELLNGLLSPLSIIQTGRENFWRRRPKKPLCRSSLISGKPYWKILWW